MRLFFIFVAIFSAHTTVHALDLSQCTESREFEESEASFYNKLDGYSITGDFKNGGGFLTYTDKEGKKSLVKANFCSAFYLCKRLGGRLPTVTELAQQAQQHGAKVKNMEIREIRNLTTDESANIIDARDENKKQREVFYYSSDGFDSEKNISIFKGNFPDSSLADADADAWSKVWSSSTAMFYYTTAYDDINAYNIQAYAIGPLGWLRPYGKGVRNAVRCVLE